MDFMGVYVLNGFFNHTRIPVRNPVDINLFKHDFGSLEVWYAATLQNIRSINKNDTVFILYKYEDEVYVEIENVIFANAQKITAYTLHGVTFIIVIEKSAAHVFTFNLEENLSHIQIINVEDTTSVEFWNLNNDVFMGLTQLNDNAIIFEWDGKQFYQNQNIATNNARKIISFSIEDERFLAIANHQNNKGETNIFSEIYKYDKQQKIFLSYQHILTHAAVDIKYFCFRHNHLKEVFLIVANSYEKDFNGNINYETNSIVYKYVEDYFLPFQSFKLDYIQQWLPAVGPSGEFILLASCKNSGITAFQYDGWRFVESDVQYRRNAFGKGITSFNSYLYKDQQLIVVANENDHGNMENVFAPTYSYQNTINEFQKDMHEWCQKTLKEVDFNDLKELNRLVELAPKIDDTEINLNTRIQFQNVTIYNLVLNDENYKTKRLKKRQISHLKQEIDEKTEQLNKINEKLNKRVNNEPIILNGNVHVRNLEIDSDRIVFEDLHTKSINNIQLDKFFNDVFFLDDPFDLTDNLQFEDLIFEGYVNPKIVNNIPVTDLVYTNSNISFENLIVEGTIKTNDLIVDGFIDDLPINPDDILLIDEDQVFQKPIKISKIKTDNLFVNHVNSLNMFTLTQNRIVDIAEHNIDTLTVKNITIGYINGMDMRSLEALVFSKNGEQEIVSNYEFDTLIVDDIEIEGLLSNTSVKNLTFTNNYTNLCLQSIIFTEDVKTEQLYVIERINQIKSNNGQLDVLLKDHPTVQYITGPKTFESINLMGPIQLRGQIKIKGLEPPIIHKKLTLKGDYEIKGTTTIETSFKFDDLLEPSGSYSMERLKNFGLKLDEKEIPVHLDFTKELIVDKIYVDKINEQNTKSWIIFDDDIPEISGQKTFANNLKINGNVSIQSINGYNLIDLYDNVLKLNGDQHVTGKHIYNKISLIRLVSNKTMINNTPWKNIMTLNKNETVAGTTILTKPVKITKFETNSAKLKNILNHNFDEMIEDTLFNDTAKKVTGKKIFKENLIFKNLIVNKINSVELNKIVEQINVWLNDLQINKSITINHLLEVDDVYFNDLNGLSNKDFGNVWLLRNGEQTIEKEQFFSKVNVKNKVNIKTNVINNINVEEIDKKAIKINEKHQIKNVEFVNSIKTSFLTLNGQINNVDINDAVISNGAKNQTILSRKMLHNNLTVGGHLHVNGHLSGLNLTLMEYFTDSTIMDKNVNVIIDGNIKFRNEFDVYNLNNQNITKISKNVWYTDKKTEVQGFVAFDNVIFEDELYINGYVDDIELVWLSKNYFSKTKNQNITAKLDFIDGIIFAQDLKAENAQITGTVANISIEQMYNHVLRNDDQIFDFHVLFDDLEVTRKFDTNFINKLNLENDVMRYDRQENIVTGFKSIKNLKAIDLNLDSGKKLQNVDVDNWFKNAVYTNGNFTIDALKILRNAKFEKNIQLHGLLNSYVFDENHIVTTNTKQKITGKKNFITFGPLINSSVVFDNLKLKGMYNNIDIEKLIEIQIDKSKEIIHINAKKHFFNTINANNINVKKLYQNVEITDLIKNITNLPNFNSYEKEYSKLIDFSKNILQVLKHQPYFIRSFKQIQKIKSEATEIFSFEEFLILMKISGKTATLLFYNWDSVSNNFNFEKDVIIQQNSEIIYGTIITLNERKHLYLEERNEQNGFTHSATIYELSAEKIDTTNNYFVSTMGTNSVASFKLPNKNQNCLINLQIADNKAFIYYETEDRLFTFIQQIDAVNGQKILSINILKIPHLFIINLAQNALENTIEILKYNDEIFQIHEILQIQNAVNFDVILYKKNYYLSVAIKHNIELENSGSIIILKYDTKIEKFTKWQTIEAMDPTHVKFNILTTNELVLHVLSNCPSEPFTIYQYNGIAGFNKKYGSSAIPIVTEITTLSTKYNDFIVVYNKREIRLIQALYEGKNVN